jgi:hypothetical protein
MSVGRPSWQKLIEHMTEELDLDKDMIGPPDSSYQMLAAAAPAGLVLKPDCSACPLLYLRF